MASIRGTLALRTVDYKVSRSNRGDGWKTAHIGGFFDHPGDSPLPAAGDRVECDGALVVNGDRVELDQVQLPLE